MNHVIFILVPLMCFLGCDEEATFQPAPIESSAVPADQIPFFDLMPGVEGGPKQAFVFGDPDDTANGYFLRFSKDFPTPPHSHSFGYRGIVLEGVMRNGPDIESALDMPAGSFWTQAADEVHITACVSDAPCLEFVSFSGPFDFLPEHTDQP